MLSLIVLWLCFYTGAGLEVFQKAPLSLAGPESSKAGKAKQKRFLKSRSAGLKARIIHNFRAPVPYYYYCCFIVTV